VKLVLSLPLFTFFALFFFDTINNPMILLIPTVFLNAFSVSPVILLAIFALTLFAPMPQPVFATALFAELTFIFPSSALGATLHFCTSLCFTINFSLPSAAATI